MEKCDKFFFFNDTATTEIYTLSLHDALPICRLRERELRDGARRLHAAGPRELRGKAQPRQRRGEPRRARSQDRKSTRLNSSHANISYAVFCLKKQNNIINLHL